MFGRCWLSFCVAIERSGKEVWRPRHCPHTNTNKTCFVTFLDCPLLRRICLLWCLIQTCIQETCQENDSAADHWHAFYKPRRVEAEIVRGEGFDSNQFKSHMQFHHVSSLVLWRSRGKWKPLHTFASLLDRGCSWHLPCKKSPPKLCLTAGKSAKLQMDANGKNIC